MDLHTIIGYPLFIVAALEFLLGIILLKQNFRQSPVIRSVAAFSFTLAGFALFAAITYVRSSLGLEYTLFTRLTWIGWFSIPAALQFIFYLKDESGRDARTVGRILYPFWLVIFLLTLFTDLVEPGHLSLVPYIGQAGPLENATRFVGAILILWVVYEIYKLRKQVSGIKKAQLNYFFHGILIFGVSGAFVVGFLQLLGGFGFDPALGAYLSLPWVVLTFYAITRYRLFDIHIIVSRTLSISLLFVLIAGIHIALFSFFDPILGSTYAILMSLSLITLLFFVTPVSRMMQQWIQNMILQGKYDYQEILKESSKAMVSILYLDDLLRYIIDSYRKSLRADTICLFLRGDDGQYVVRHGFAVHDALAKGQALDQKAVALIQNPVQIVVREELESMLPAKEFAPLNAYLKKIGAELLVPMQYQGKLQGLLTLGLKGNGEPYVQSDIDLLETLAGQAAVAIENARLYEEAKQVRQSLEESEQRFHDLYESAIRKYLSL